MIATVASPNFLFYYPLFVWIPFLILMPIYLNTEKTGPFRSATALKLILSLMCATSAFLSYVAAGWNDIPRLLVALGLIFAVFGDYYLQFIRLDENKFIKGILFFAATQVFLILSLFMRYGIGWLEFVITVVLLLLALVLMTKQKWELGGAQKPLMLYTLLLAFMASKAVSAAIRGGGTTAVLMALGGAFFFLSDLILGIWNYKTSKRMHANLNWICYFTGIMLISISNSPYLI